MVFILPFVKKNQWLFYKTIFSHRVKEPNYADSYGEFFGLLFLLVSKWIPSWYEQYHAKNITLYLVNVESQEKTATDAG